MAMLLNKDTFGINMSGACITFAVLLRVFQAADLRWEMHFNQLFSIEIQSMFMDTPTSVETNFTEEATTELFKKKTTYTLMGIPVMLRSDYPETWIRLYMGKKLVAYIENLAVPVGCNPQGDSNEHMQKEANKAQKIREND
jgi:hypothetical protein